MKWVVTVLLPVVIVPLLLDVFTDWSPQVAQWIVAHASRRMPKGYRKRCADEWRAYITDIPGGLSQLAVALGYWIRIPLLRKAVGAPAFRFQAGSTISQANLVLRRCTEAFNNVVKAVSAVFEIVKTVVDVLRDIGEGAMGGGIFIGWLGGIVGGVLGGAGAMGGGMLSGSTVGIVLGTVATIIDMILQNRARRSTSATRSRSSTGS